MAQIHAGLPHAWLILPYVLCGLFAWHRKPSRFGPLVIYAGFAACRRVDLRGQRSNLVSTVEMAFDLVPFAVFMHVFLAFPTGGLRSQASGC